MSKILHQKIPMDKKNGCMLISSSTALKLHNSIQECLPEDYILITTPTDLNIIDGGDTMLVIDAKEYSYDELTDIIEKASMYDGLNK
jgi:hypothetical protein